MILLNLRIKVQVACKSKTSDSTNFIVFIIDDPISEEMEF